MVPAGRAAAIAVLTQLAVGGCGSSLVQSVPAPGPTYLQLLDGYAESLGTSLGVGADGHTAVIQAGVFYEPGTIVIPGQGEFGRCNLLPKDFPQPDSEISWTPPAGPEQEFTVDFDLPVGVLRAFAVTDAKISIGSRASLSFENLTQHTADVSIFERTIISGSCAVTLRQALEQGKPVTVVLGTISAKQVFNFDLGASPQATRNQSVGTFDVALTPDNRAISMVETSPSVHFLVTYSSLPTKRQDQSR